MPRSLPRKGILLSGPRCPKMKNGLSAWWKIPDRVFQNPEHIDRFYKVNEFKQGTGLGLSICEAIIELLGGQTGWNQL